MRDDVFHAGEIAIQERVGVRGLALRNGRMVGDRVGASALPFLAQQRVVAAATTDTEGRVWASLWFGERGFIRGNGDGTRVSVDHALARIPPDDPVHAVLKEGTKLGLLAIDLQTRRRLRINGTVRGLDQGSLTLAVEEAFPNCPKYIQMRHFFEQPDIVQPQPTERGETLDEARRALVRSTDTLFVASRHPERGADASHRGGPPGFVQVIDERTLRIPDYPGNGMFQTLGNLALHAHAGVVIAGFEAGRLLSISGAASIVPGVENPTGETGLSLELHVERWIELSVPSTYRWKLVETSPFNPPAGD